VNDSVAKLSSSNTAIPREVNHIGDCLVLSKEANSHENNWLQLDLAVSPWSMIPLSKGYC
jgi:hypothetical protein